MQDPGAITSATLGRRGDAHWARARGSLALGRHAEALDAVRRARRYRSAVEGPLLALAEGDALLGLQRYREVVGVATRALGRGALQPDLKARLRVLRGHGLWLTGRVASGGGEVRRAAAEAEAPLTRGRVHEALALFAWKGQELEKARRPPAPRPRRLRRGRTAGRARCASSPRRRGSCATRPHGRGAAWSRTGASRRASAAGRADLVAEARADRASLFTALGRWAEAEQELDVAGELFSRIGDGRDTATAGLVRVVVDLARGDLPRARATLDRAREWMAERGNVRGLAETLLLTSDLHLAARQPGDADRTALESLDLYRVVRDAEGQCRSRIRRAHALIELGRVADAATEARRALAKASPSRPDLAALAQLALGRALLRDDRRGRGAGVRAGRRGWWPAGPRLPAPPPSAARSRAGARPRRRRGARRPGRDRGVGRSPRARRFASADLADLAPRPTPAPADRVAGGDRRPDPASSSPMRRRRSWSEGPWEERWAAAMLRAAAGASVVARGAGRGHRLGAARRPRPRGAAAAAGSRARPGRRRRGRVGAARRRGMGRAPDAGPARPRRRHRRPGLAGRGAVRRPARRAADVSGGARADPRRRASAGVPTPGAGRRRGDATGLSGDRRTAAPRCRTFWPRWPGWRLPTSPSTSSARRARARRRVAKALHARSARARGPFVAVNASSLGDELFEAEMFGHVRGAFTGAVGGARGLRRGAPRAARCSSTRWPTSRRAPRRRLLRFLRGARVPPGRGDARCGGRTSAW